MEEVAIQTDIKYMFYQVRIKALTISRLELCAAVVAAQTDSMIRQEQPIPELETNSVFWTVSATVLRYLNNETKSFHTFVTSRVQKIKNVCGPSQWHHVPSKENSEDLLTRGLSIEEFLKCDYWKNGSGFLWQQSENWPSPLQEQNIPDLTEDPEVKKGHALRCAVNVEQDINFLEKLCEKYSNWHKMKQAMRVGNPH